MFIIIVLLLLSLLTNGDCILDFFKYQKEGGITSSAFSYKLNEIDHWAFKQNILIIYGVYHEDLWRILISCLNFWYNCH